MSDDSQSEGVMVEGVQPGDRSSSKMALAVGVVIVAVVGGCVALGGGKESASGQASDARTVCRKAVEQQLKDPRSAEFSDETTSIVSDTEPRFEYLVKGTVRSRNSFGGMAVMVYTCDATYTVSTGGMRGVASVTGV